MIAHLLVALLGQEPVPLEIPAVLRRSPTELPRAEPGRWSESTEIDPDVGSLARRADERFRALDYPGALTALYAALEAAPDYPSALVYLGLTYFRLQRYGDAVVAYERFLEVRPGELARTHALGHSYYSLGEYRRAREHYERILAVVPQSPEALRGVALSLFRLGASDAALKRLDEALAIAPRDADVLLWAGRIRYEVGESERALAYAERSIEVTPYDPRPWFLRMQALYDLGREDEALAAEERWRELDRVAQELRTIQGIVRIHPERFDLIGRSVELHRAVGDMEAVRAALARLERARPSDVPLGEVLVFALDTLWSLEDREAAEVYAQRLERECPDDLAAWKRLELHFALKRDRVNQIRAGKRVAELEGR